MTRASFTVLFYIKRTKLLQDGMAPIYARITVNSQRCEFGLQKSIYENQWDNKKGCVQGFSKSAKELNSYLDFVKAILLFKKREKEESGRLVSAFELKNCYLGIDVDNKTILQVFQDRVTTI